MDIKNVDNASYWQVDHEIKKIAKLSRAEVLKSSQAWEKYSWTRKYFEDKPNEGYFVWIKKQPVCSLFTCVSLVSKNIKQQMKNLLIIEENLKVELQGTCNSLAKNTGSSHKAVGKIILKKNSSLKYKHIHSWKEDSIVDTDYEFLLGENSKLSYTYKASDTPKLLNIKNKITCLDGAKALIKILADCKNTRFNTKDEIILQGKEASGISKLRLISRKDSIINAHSRILAKSASMGHLDCHSLMTDKKSKVSLIPEVICKNKDAQVTHEASIGRVSEEQLNYLRTRGLTEEEALNLIIAGFLKV